MLEPNRFTTAKLHRHESKITSTAPQRGGSHPHGCSQAAAGYYTAKVPTGCPKSVHTELCGQNADASPVLSREWGETTVESKRKKALWFSTQVLEENFLLQKTNKDIPWTSLEGTLKKYFIQSILVSGYSLIEKLGAAGYKGKLNLFVLVPNSVP